MSTAVAERPAAPDPSPAQRQKARLDAFMGAVEKRQDQIGTLLSDSGVDPKLFLETCRRALMRDPELVKTDAAAFIQAALNCAADGLIPDGRKAAIVRYKNSAQYVPMYQGLLDIAYRSGNFQSIEAHVVYAGDEFDYDMGDQPFIRHRRSLEASDVNIIGAYAIARTTNGGVFREVMGKADLAKVKAVSKAANGPNKDWPGEMARKAPIRRLWKFLPKTAAMDRVALHDDATYDQTALASANDAPRRLGPGFNPPALADQSDVGAMPGIDDVLDGDFAPVGDSEAEGGDGFPGDRPAQGGGKPRQQAEAPKTATEALNTVQARIDAFKARCDKAPSVKVLREIGTSDETGALARDIDAGDPEEVGTSAELEKWFNALVAERDTAERAAAAAGGDE